MAQAGHHLLLTLSLKNGGGVHACRGSLIHGEDVTECPPGWVLKSYKRLGSYPVLALKFFLVCGDNGQSRRMMQVSGRSGACWAESS